MFGISCYCASVVVVCSDDTAQTQSSAFWLELGLIIKPHCTARISDDKTVAGDDTVQSLFH